MLLCCVHLFVAVLFYFTSLRSADKVGRPFECVHVQNSWNQSEGIILPACLSGRIIGRYKKIGKHLTGSIQTPCTCSLKNIGSSRRAAPEIKKPQASILIWSGEYKFDEVDFFLDVNLKTEIHISQRKFWRNICTGSVWERSRVQRSSWLHITDSYISS